MTHPRQRLAALGVAAALTAGATFAVGAAPAVASACIGVPGDDTAAHDAGTVDVVDEDDEGTQLKITGFRALTDPHPVAGGAFGWAVSTSGGDLIGAPGNAGGRAYLFDLGGSGSSTVTLSATFRQSTGARSPGYGASFSNSYRT